MVLFLPLPVPKNQTCLLVSGHYKSAKWGVSTGWCTDTSLCWTNTAHSRPRRVIETLLAGHNGRSALGSSTVRQHRGSSCFKLTNKYMFVIFYRPRARGLLGDNMIWHLLLLFLNAGKTKQFPSNRRNHAQTGCKDHSAHLCPWGGKPFLPL